MTGSGNDREARHPAADDPLTLIALGVAAVLLAALTHEFLGHGLACLAERGRITLLTLLVFRCDGAGVLTDGAGPVAVLLVGWAVLGTLLIRRSAPPGSGSLFLLILAMLLVFWAPAQAVREAIDGSDDWGHVARDLNWPPPWHGVVAVAGVLLYVLAVRAMIAAAIRIVPGRPLRLVLPYVAAAITGTTLAALWHGDRIGSAIDAALTFGATPLGALLAVSAAARRSPAGMPIARQWLWIGAVSAALLLFALTIARGVGPLA